MEVFMLFDRDEDGVLSFAELTVVMKSLGQRPTEEELLLMVREVSEDFLYDTIEFNEFLQMMSKQQGQPYTTNALAKSFKFFDEDKDGFMGLDELKHVVTSLGDKMSNNEVKEMLEEADKEKDGIINYNEFSSDISRKQVKKKKKRRI